MARVLHTKSLTFPQESYTGLSYVAPLCGTGSITLKGLDVTDNGFGVWNYTLPIIGQMPFDAAGTCNGMPQVVSEVIEVIETVVF